MQIRPIHYSFAREYVLAGGNAARAYRKIRPHVTARSSKVVACRWMADAGIRALVEETCRT